MARGLLLIATVIFLGINASAQTKWADKKDIEVLTPFKHPAALYGAFSVRNSRYDVHSIWVLGLKGGILPASWLSAGLEANVFVPNVKSRTYVEDKEITIYGWYGGLAIEPALYPQKEIHAVFPFSIGTGWIGYLVHYDEEQPQGTGGIIDGDLNWYAEQGLGVEANLTPNLKAQLVYSYRYSRRVTLPRTPVNAFTGHNISLVVKLGSFHKRYPYSRARYVH